jgi:hypothetical protein
MGLTCAFSEAEGLITSSRGGVCRVGEIRRWEWKMAGVTRSVTET